MFRIGRVFRLEMAHRLLDTHTPACQRLHGHSYKVEVSLQSPALNSDQMVMDFTLLKTVWMEKVHAVLDHKTALYEGDGLIEYMECGESIVRFERQPTAEYLARWIHDTLMVSVPGLAYVKIWETEDSWAQYGKV